MQEAELLCGALSSTLDRLSQALHWVERGLPLLDTPCPMLVTAEGRPLGPAPSCAGSPGSPTQPQLAHEVLAARPQWGKRLALPPHWSRAISEAVEAAAPALAVEGKKGAPVSPGSGASEGPVLTVWLAGPLGPMAARVGGRELEALCRGGGGSAVSVAAAPAGPGVRLAPLLRLATRGCTAQHPFCGLPAAAYLQRKTEAPPSHEVGG